MTSHETSNIKNTYTYINKPRNKAWGIFLPLILWYNTNMIPEYLYKYFWDTNPANIDIKENGSDIIHRILNEGDTMAIKWMFRNFETNLIKEVIMERRGFTPRSLNFWRLFFDIPKDKILCLNKSYQGERKMLWPY
jgi:hypothetical protein